MKNTRGMIAMMLAAGTFGGVIGALATAATQSQANPQAIAAAVQKVSDASADRSLRSIRQDLDQVARPSKVPLNFVLATVQSELYAICRNVQPSSFPAVCPPQDLFGAKDSRSR